MMRGAIDDDEPVGAGKVGAAAESAFDDGEKREKEERDGERADGQEEANFFAKEIGENQATEISCGTSRVSVLLRAAAFDQHTLVEMQA